MSYALVDSVIGANPIGNTLAADAVGSQRHALGSIVHGVDPYYGGGSFIYLKCGAGALAVGSVCVWDGLHVAIVVPNTANTGRSVCVAMHAMTVGQFGWFQIEGIAVMLCTASVAAGVTFGITGAGTIGTNAAGKQILNATSAVASTGTVIKTGCTLLLGSGVVQVPNADGWYVGLTLSGTGIPASSEITSIAADGRSVVMSELCTVSGIAITVTGTHTGFLLAQIQRPFVQGAIT
jgi:hypothetical protein